MAYPSIAPQSGNRLILCVAWRAREAEPNGAGDGTQAQDNWKHSINPSA